MNVLVLNAGSSTLKFQLISTDLDHIKQNADERLCRGQVERIGGEAIITLETHKDQRHKVTAPIRDVSAALDYVLRWLASDRSGVDEIRNLGQDRQSKRQSRPQRQCRECDGAVEQDRCDKQLRRE